MFLFHKQLYVFLYACIVRRGSFFFFFFNPNMLDEQPGFFLILPAVPFLKQIDAKTFHCKLAFPLNYLSTELFFFRTESVVRRAVFPRS